MFNITSIIPVIVVIYLLSSIKILREYERGVVFRLGRVLPQPKGPGILLVFAPIHRMVRISLRIDARGCSQYGFRPQFCKYKGKARTCIGPLWESDLHMRHLCIYLRQETEAPSSSSECAQRSRS
jgi:hypothetical protein